MGAAYALILLVARGGASGPLRELLLGSARLTALVLVRQVTALRDNARLMAQLHQLAATDSLTGLLNRRGFAASAEREIARSAHFGGCVTAVMLDIDHFKRINDVLGHSVGDEVIAWVARLCQRHLRAVDVLARYGGDEMVAVLFETRIDQAVVAMERLGQRRSHRRAHLRRAGAGVVQHRRRRRRRRRRARPAAAAGRRRPLRGQAAGRGCTRSGALVMPAV